MTHYGRAYDHISLRPRWKGNLCLLGVTAAIVWVLFVLMH
jgi:hypothetical protein